MTDLATPAGARALRRVAIVNRGAAATRLIRAVREYNQEHGLEIQTIALHSEVDRRATFVREADEAVTIGRGDENPYLDHDEVSRALVACRADAAWVGWGLVAEDPSFAELCARLGILFIGPSADAIRRVRDRTSAKLLAEQAGIAVLASSTDSVDVLDALGDGGRHVEVGVIADEYGSVWAAGVRDCSLQLRGQKLVEESRSPALASEQEEELVAAALALIRAAGYRNAGTVEFLYDPTRRSFALSEIHASLQVAHPVTEVTTGLDLVKLQLEVAAGGRLPHERPTTLGHAIGARLLAHDPERGLEPAPGTIELFQLPTGAGVRVDSGVAEGEVITPAYDSVLAEVVAWGRDRSEARARLRCALADATVVIRGGITNKTFLLHLLDHPDVSAGHADAGWLDRLVEAGAHVPREHADVALLAAAVDSYDAEEDDERERFYASAARGRPRATQEIDRTLELVHRGQAYRVQVGEVGPARYRVTVDGVTVYLDAERLGRFQSRLRIGARTFRVVSLLDGADHVVEVEGVGHRVSVNE
ncbi:MAG: acetyl-CoA carboxylase biotin carboxylase subunit family protein, partial [Solirubrobacterales bacterium]|nr:acetyl-CoA carboxylase biotin carboxylase subunit family protein [Solirubrobacterales bacterium]